MHQDETSEVDHDTGEIWFGDDYPDTEGSPIYLSTGTPSWWSRIMNRVSQWWFKFKYL